MSPNKTQKQKILITGVSGLLGNNLAWFFKEEYQVLGLYHRHPVSIERIATREVNLLSLASLKECLVDFQPDILIHCAALADIDHCEKFKAEAMEINVHGTRNIVEGLKGLSTRLVHISTDAVYDGKKGNYTEEDPVQPVNHYGWTKYYAEKEALRREGALVLRTTIFGWNILDKTSLGEWILKRLKAGQRIQGFDDVCFSGIYTMDFAKLIAACLQKNLAGTYISASRTAMSKYDFALELARVFGLDSGLIQKASVADLRLPAERGKNLSLCADKLEKDLGTTLPTLQESISHFYRDYQRELPQQIRG